MRALQFLADPEPWPEPLPDDAPELLKHLATTPMALLELPDPPLLGDDWMVLRNRLTGICGSDSKQVLMDFDGSADNLMTAFISFPQVLGHEVVATVEATGPDAHGFEVGQRVVLYPNLGCRPRGIMPLCPACERGDYSICWNFHSGRLSAGIHTGNAVEATGGFADLVPAHTSMAYAVPDDIPDEVAVLADPWSVSFHAITRNPPAPGSKVVVYGGGALGSTAATILAQLYPSVDVAVVARHDAQATRAAATGATVLQHEPGEELGGGARRLVGRHPPSPVGGTPLLLPGPDRHRLRHRRLAAHV
ncbi:MAG: alcohol dehydrogenase catalytic domain-containing protein [Acidimicrobiales bacterium]